jgi:hypothetical protein
MAPRASQWKHWYTTRSDSTVTPMVFSWDFFRASEQIGQRIRPVCSWLLIISSGVISLSCFDKSPLFRVAAPAAPYSVPVMHLSMTLELLSGGSLHALLAQVQTGLAGCE